MSLLFRDPQIDKQTGRQVDRLTDKPIVEDAEGVQDSKSLNLSGSFFFSGSSFLSEFVYVSETLFVSESDGANSRVLARARTDWSCITAS